MSFTFSTKYLSESRVDRKRGDETTYYDALVKGHSSQYGTVLEEEGRTPGYLTLAYDYETDEDEKEWLKILIIKISRDLDHSIVEDWIPTTLLEKRPLTFKDFEEGINPIHWLDSINKIWRKSDDS